MTRWKKRYAWTLLKSRKLPTNVNIEGEWELVFDGIRYVGAKGTAGRMIARKIVCYRPTKDKRPAKWFVIWTGRMDVKAKKLVKIYVVRWPIEVFFQHIKSNLRTVHFPTRSPQGPTIGWSLLL